MTGSNEFDDSKLRLDSNYEIYPPVRPATVKVEIQSCVSNAGTLS